MDWDWILPFCKRVKSIEINEESMVNGPNKKSTKHVYPKFWDKFIPVAVILIVVIIALLAYITVRVALGMSAF